MHFTWIIAHPGAEKQGRIFAWLKYVSIHHIFHLKYTFIVS